MSERLFLVILGLALVSLTSCTDQQNQGRIVALAKNAPAAPREAEDDTTPSLMIASRQDVLFGAGTKATVWDLRGQKVKELTVRLLVYKNGQTEQNNSLTSCWQVQPPILFRSQLALLVEDGQAFGAKGRRRPALTLSFGSDETLTTADPGNEAVIPGQLAFSTVKARGAGPLSEKQVLFLEVFAPVKDRVRPFSLDREEGLEKQLTELSKDGAAALGVSLEWKSW